MRGRGAEFRSVWRKISHSLHKSSLQAKTTLASSLRTPWDPQGTYAPTHRIPSSEKEWGKSSGERWMRRFGFGCRSPTQKSHIRLELNLWLILCAQTLLQGPCSRTQARKAQHPPQHLAYPDRGCRNQGGCPVLPRKGTYIFPYLAVC